MAKSTQPAASAQSPGSGHGEAHDRPRGGVPDQNRTLLLFPGALGDFLCALPAIDALCSAATGSLTLVARAELFPLLGERGFDLVSIDRREIADLFGAGRLAGSTRELFAGHTLVHSWTGHGDERFRSRLEAATGGRVCVHPFRGMRAGEHAAHYFARCLSVPAPVLGAPHPSARLIEPAAAAVEWAADLWGRCGLGPRTLLLHPGSGSRRKNWEGMAEVASEWPRRAGGQVLLVVGPAELERASPSLPRHDGLLAAEPLDRVAAVLRRAWRYLGNDSGVSHLAGAVGAPGLVLFGPTDPGLWRPLGSTLRVVAAPRPCEECGPDRFCLHRLPLEAVFSALGRGSG